MIPWQLFLLLLLVTNPIAIVQGSASDAISFPPASKGAGKLFYSYVCSN